LIRTSLVLHIAAPNLNLNLTLNLNLNQAYFWPGWLAATVRASSTMGRGRKLEALEPWSPGAPEP